LEKPKNAHEKQQSEVHAQQHILANDNDHDYVTHTRQFLLCSLDYVMLLVNEAANVVLGVAFMNVVC